MSKSESQLDVIQGTQESFSDLVQKILALYKKGSTEPLDGDEIEKLSKIIQAEMDLQEGNLTEAEYDRKIKEITGAIVRCPNDVLHDKFSATAYEMHNWLLNSRGQFIKDLGQIKVISEPNLNDFICEICGAEAITLCDNIT